MELPARDPILRTAAASTGSVRIHPEHARATRMPLWIWLTTSRRWTEPLPINIFVIEHDRGVVLFDGGQDRRSVTDPDYFPGGPLRLMFRRLASFEIGPDQTVPQLLESAGFDPGRVTHLVLSHFHQDHIGAIADLPGAQVVASQAEWRDLVKPAPSLRGYLRNHIDLPGVRWRLIDFTQVGDGPIGPFESSVDLFGDGSLRLIDTPGHTRGSMSLLITRPHRPPALLVGDLTYDAQHFDRDHVPGVGDRRTLRATTDRVNRLRSQLPKLVIVAAHDPHAAEKFDRAMRADNERQ
jgi:N-acyl homoserine lactone hydrolase